MLLGTLSQILLLAGVFGWGGTESAKYLATVGPVSLRVQVPIESPNKYPLRPLLMEPVQKPAQEEPATNNIHSAVSPPPEPSGPTLPAADPANMQPLDPPSSGTPGAPAGIEPGTNGPPVVTPQMFLRFFSKDGTRETTVVAPPPGSSPQSQRSSSATYTIK